MSLSRALTAAALLLAAGLVALVLLGGQGSDYRVKAVFRNASLLVKGNEVKTGGVPIGTVRSIRLGARGEAEVTLEIEEAHRPLRQGTQAIIRQTSLAGVANRYIDLRLAPSTAPALDDGATLPATDTLSAVDLDQLFNTFDARTRRALTALVRGSGRALDGRGDELRAAMLYLDPAIASSTRLLEVLDGARDDVRSFLGSSARLAADLGARDDQIAGAVDGLATTMDAIGRRRGDLGDAVERLPPVLRRSNSTFVSLRAALDDLQPVVEDTRPVARALRPFAGEARRLATGARPALRDTARVVRRPGRDNDLLEALPLLGPLRDAAVRPAGERPSTFSSLTEAMKGSTPTVAFVRPYGVDMTGWFDDFGTTGVYDALGGMGRIAFHSVAYANVGGTLTFVPPELRQAVFQQVAQRAQRDRCPGSMERGAVWKPTPDFNCDPSQVPAGP